MAEPSIIELLGRIDSATASAIEGLIANALDSSPAVLVLDMSQTTFVSSVGLRILLMAAKRCNQQKTRLALHSVPAQTLELFRISGLTSFLSVFPNRESALMQA